MFPPFLHTSAKCNNKKIFSIELASCIMCNVDNRTICTVQFADGQVVMAQSKEDLE